MLSPDVQAPQPNFAPGGSRKRNRQERSRDSAPGAVGGGEVANYVDNAGGGGEGSAGSSAFLDSFYNDQHLKRMKIFDGLSTPSCPVYSVPPPDSRLDPLAGLSTTSSPFFSASPEECIHSISANHVVLVDLDTWAKPWIDIGGNWRTFPEHLFLYGFSSSAQSGTKTSDLSHVVSKNPAAYQFFINLSNGGHFLLHRQPEFGVEMTLRYQASRLDVILDVTISITILAGQKSGLEELRKQFAFNAMRNRRDIVILDPATCTYDELVQRILFVNERRRTSTVSTPAPTPPAVDDTAAPQQPQPIIIDP